MSRDGFKRLVSSVSDPRISKTVAPSSAGSIPPEVVLVRSVSNKKTISSSAPPSNTNPPAVVSGTAEGVGIVPPPIASVSLAEPVFADRVQHFLIRSFEPEEIPGLFSQFLQFANSKKHAPVVSSLSSAPAALGAPPPDGSFSSQPCGGPTPGVEESVSSAPYFQPDFGLDRELDDPSLTVNQNVMGRRGLYASSRVPRVESRALSFNSSGMLNQTGQVDRLTIPPSLTLPSRSSVPRSRFFSCPSSSPSFDLGVRYRLSNPFPCSFTGGLSPRG